MIDRILDFPQSLWLAAFAFYAWDCARLVPPGTLLLTERRNGSFLPSLARVPFEMRGRELYIPALLLPWRGVFAASWADSRLGERSSATEVGHLRQRLIHTRWASSVNFLLLFIVAPLLTSVVGLGGTVLLVAPIVYAINAGIGLHIARAPARYGLSRRQGSWLLLDALLCAPYGANWTKRVTRYAPQLDLSKVREQLDPSERAALEGTIAARQADERREAEQ